MKNKELRGLINSYFRKKGLPIQPALAFRDVVIYDLFSKTPSRAGFFYDLKTSFAGDIGLHIPIVSANMDTVTDSRMAVEMARRGGIGCLHQFAPLLKRKEEVAAVKRADNARIENPITIKKYADFGAAKQVMDKYGISSILVVDENGIFCGILTSRDYRFIRDGSISIEKLMTSDSLIVERSNISKERAREILEREKLEKLPLVDKNGRVAGLITAKDIIKEREFPMAVRDRNGRLRVAVAVRLNSDFLKEAEVLLEAGADVLLIDTARANSELARRITAEIKKNFSQSLLIVGNIDTPEAALMLIEAGADCLKVGVGPGSPCKTRQVAGVGIPQLTAIAMCAAVARKYKISIIADGGIRGSDDLAKAIVAGADAVMIGSLLAGTDESPGEMFREGNQQWKMYRGSASLEHQLDRIEFGNLDRVRLPEGIQHRIPYTGPAKAVLDELLEGLRSSMSFVGAKNLEYFWEKGKFLWQTSAGYEEGKPRV